MAWTIGRILIQLSPRRVQCQSFASATPEGSSGQRQGPNGSLESESGTKLNTDGFPRASPGSYMESLFSKWLQDHRSIHRTWHRYFKDLVERTASTSAKSDPSVKPGSESGQEEILSQQPMLGSILPAEEHVTQAPEQMTQQKAPKEPESAAKGDRKGSCRKQRWIPKFSLIRKFTKFRRRASCKKKTDKCSRSKCRRKRRSKRNCKKNKYSLFKSFYEDKLNKEKAEQSKQQQDGDKDNKLREKPQEKPQGDAAYDSNQTPNTLTFESLDAVINDLDNATANMELPYPNNQERARRVKLLNFYEASKLWKMPSDMKSFTDLPRALIDHLEVSSKSGDQVIISEDKGTVGSRPSASDETNKPQPDVRTKNREPSRDP